MLKRLFGKKKETPESKRTATPVQAKTTSRPYKSGAISSDYALGHDAEVRRGGLCHSDSSNDSSGYKSSGFDSYSSSSDGGGGGGCD